MPQTMIVHSPLSLAHETGEHHIESKERYTVIIKALQAAKLLTEESEWIATPCSEQWVSLCHTREYMDLVKSLCTALPMGEVTDLPTGDVKISHASYAAALAMVGGALHAADAIMATKCRNAFVVARPPGHHAERARGMGFCLFNTIAIAARYIQKQYGIQKVAIIDWDVHHGNGTEKEFFDDSCVYYFSTHQKGAYPGTGEEEVHGTGGNIGNYPVSPGPKARETLLRLYCEQLPAIMERFRPHFVLISCGFDAHRLDPIASMSLETEDFRTLTKVARTIAERWCHGRLLSVLEGGYHLQALAESAVVHVEELMAGD